MALCMVGNAILVFPGKGDGTFGPAIVTPLSVVTVTGEMLFGLQPAIADFDGDRSLDIVVLAGTPDTQSNGKSGVEGGAVYLLRGNGDGTFQTPQPVAAFAGTVGITFVVADFNGDSKPDLAALSVAGFSSDTQKRVHLNIALGQGDSTFRLVESYSIDFGFELAVADVNGDNKPDLVVSGFSLSDSEAAKDASAGLGVFLGMGRHI